MDNSNEALINRQKEMKIKSKETMIKSENDDGIEEIEEIDDAIEEIQAEAPASKLLRISDGEGNFSL